ncbi:hypothetical protein [Paenibacillus sophorae]|nr:hypothetical protein [Paenibacillus sophorae]
MKSKKGIPSVNGRYAWFLKRIMRTVQDSTGQKNVQLPESKSG